METFGLTGSGVQAVPFTNLDCLYFDALFQWLDIFD